MREITLSFFVTDEEITGLLNRAGARSAEPHHEQPETPGSAPEPSTEFDAFGVPYNAEYHAKNKSKKENGAWKAANRMSAEQKAAAKAYNASHMTSAPPSNAPSTPPAPPTNAPATPPAPPAATIAPPTPPAPPAAPPSVPAPPAIPAPPAVATPVSFAELADKFNSVISTNGNDALMAHLGNIYAQCGCSTDGAELENDPEARIKVHDKLIELFG